jgi:hypothetical protein
VAVQVSEGGDTVDTNEPVFVVEVIGPFPHYERPSVPAGVNPSMRCRAISFTVNTANWHVLDAGCGAAFNISKLGQVRRLPTRP